MATNKKVEPARFFMVGDKVLWKGIKLSITEVRKDGSLIAASNTMRVHVSGPDQLERFTGN